MQKSAQLKLLVFVFFIIIISIWFYINRGFSGFNFSLDSSLLNLRDQINQSISKTELDSKVSQLTTGIETAKNILKQGVSTTSMATSSDSFNSDIAKEVAEEIVGKISNSTNTENFFIDYKYDPWKIEFKYLSDAKKNIDEKNQVISLIYDENSNAYIYHKELKERNFGEWLAKNFNLDDLDKKNINNYSFWTRFYEGSGFKSRDYYMNYNKSIFIITINYKKEVDENKLMGIVNSFKIIK